MSRLVLALAGIAIAPAALLAAPVFDARHLPPGLFPAGTEIEGIAINHHGEVAGAVRTIGQGFRWSAADGVQFLQDLPGGVRWVVPVGIDDAGRIAGLGSVPDIQYPTFSGSRATVWGRDNLPHDLQPLLGHARWPDPNSYAYALNQQGAVSVLVFSGSQQQAYVLDATGHRRPLPGGFLPFHLNDLGMTAGIANNGGVQTIAAVADASGHVTRIPQLDDARALNNAGTVVGYQTRGNDWVPGVWDAKRGARDLPILAGTTSCWPMALNNDGVAVGWCAATAVFGADQHAVMWTPHGDGYTVHDLRTLTAAGGLDDDPPGCTYYPNGMNRECHGEAAAAINDAGQVLVNHHWRGQGDGVHLRMEPVVLTPR